MKLQLLPLGPKQAPARQKSLRTQAACAPQYGLQSASRVQGKHSPSLAQYPALPVVVKHVPISPVLVVQAMFWPDVPAVGWHPPLSWALHFFLPFFPLHMPEQQSFAFWHFLPTFLQPEPAELSSVSRNRATPPSRMASVWRREGVAGSARVQRSNRLAFMGLSPCDQTAVGMQ
jgi:hypothetical protein